MKFTNSPFAILDKNMSSLDYQKRNLYMRTIGENKDQVSHLLWNLKKEV